MLTKRSGAIGVATKLLPNFFKSQYIFVVSILDPLVKMLSFDYFHGHFFKISLQLP